MTLRRRRGVVRHGPPTATRQGRIDVRWGIAGLLGVILLAVAFGVVGLVKFGATTYTAEFSDAGAIRVGDDVRIAGVPVGSVKSVTLEPDHVDVRFSVDHDVFIGDQTSLDVKMLTIVGGHYLAVHPAGTKPLGQQRIPQDRVVLPYSLPEIFQDAIQPIKGIDGNVLRDNFGALEASLNSQPKSIHGALTAATTLVDILNRQNSDISRTLAVADEYLGALRGNISVVGTFVRSLNLLETLVENNIWAVGSLNNTAEVVDGVAGIGREWQSTLKPMARPLANSIPDADALMQKLGQLLTSVRGMLGALKPLVGPHGTVSVDQSGVTMPGPGLCIPVPGRVC